MKRLLKIVIGIVVVFALGIATIFYFTAGMLSITAYAYMPDSPLTVVLMRIEPNFSAFPEFRKINKDK